MASSNVILFKMLSIESRNHNHPWRDTYVVGMKVAMLTYSLRPRGGVVHALNLAEALQIMGIEVTLFSLRRHDSPCSSKKFFRETSVPVTVFEFNWHDDMKERLRAMTEAFIDGLPRDFDIYHAQDCVCDTALQLMAAEEAIPSPTVRTVHHVEGFQDTYLNKCEMTALLGDTVKITVSEYWKEQLHNRHGLDSIVIHNGVDTNKFGKTISPRKPLVLFVGGMESRKGLEFAIQTLEVLVKKGRELNLIAIARPGFKGVETRAWFDHLIERCGLVGKVEIHELIDDEELARLYATASVFFLPTRMEGWGLSIMEAMASGSPIVSTPVGGITELVHSGENGLLVPVGDVHGFAEAIERLIDDKVLRDRLCAAAKETVKRFTWDASAKKTIELYNGIISARG
jgi:glycosyltransferase involved in cell wall biosynthesis